MTISTELTENNNLENFHYILSRYSSYEKSLRQVKLNTIFGKKSILCVNDMKPALRIDGLNEENEIIRNILRCDSFEMEIDKDLKVTRIHYNIIEKNAEIESILPYQIKMVGYDKPQVNGFFVKEF